jgi:hypothetical protein
MKSDGFQVGDRVYLVFTPHVTGTVVAVIPAFENPYKVRIDGGDPLQNTDITYCMDADLEYWTRPESATNPLDCICNGWCDCHRSPSGEACDCRTRTDAEKQQERAESNRIARILGVSAQGVN